MTSSHWLAILSRNHQTLAALIPTWIEVAFRFQGTHGRYIKRLPAKRSKVDRGVYGWYCDLSSV